MDAIQDAENATKGMRSSIDLLVAEAEASRGEAVGSVRKPSSGRKIPLDQLAYWGVFLFAATSMTYMLVTLIHLSTEEETRFLPAATVSED